MLLKVMVINMASIPFRTAFRRPQTEPASSGSDMLADYQKSIDKDGQTVLVKTLKNLTDEIQAMSVQCDIDNIIQRASVGDESALNQVKDLLFGDTVGAPKNMIEAHAQIKRARLEFDSLPLEVRKLFNFNVEEFINEYGSDDFKNKLDSLNPKVIEPVNVLESNTSEGGENNG